MITLTEKLLNLKYELLMAYLDRDIQFLSSALIEYGHGDVCTVRQRYGTFCISNESSHRQTNKVKILATIAMTRGRYSIFTVLTGSYRGSLGLYRDTIGSL